MDSAGATIPSSTQFDKNWIDAAVREGKSPGAFSHPTVPSVHPYILMNFQGKPRDVSGLATATEGPEYAACTGLIQYACKRWQSKRPKPLGSLFRNLLKR